MNSPWVGSFHILSSPPRLSTRFDRSRAPKALIMSSFHGSQPLCAPSSTFQAPVCCWASSSDIHLLQVLRRRHRPGTCLRVAWSITQAPLGETQAPDYFHVSSQSELTHFSPCLPSLLVTSAYLPVTCFLALTIQNSKKLLSYFILIWYFKFEFDLIVLIIP